MLSLDDSVWLKILAWFLQYPFYIFWFIIKFFLSERRANKWDTIQAPQYPQTIVITGASQGLPFVSIYIQDGSQMTF